MSARGLRLIEQGVVALARGLGIAGPPVRYRVAGHEILPEEMDRSLGGVLRAARAAVTAPVISLPLRVERILVRRNVRLFGIAARPGTTARIAIEDVQSRSALRDIAARRLAAALVDGRAFGIPRVSAHDRGTGSWCLEEYVPGRHATPADMRALARDHGVTFYGATARPRPVARWRKVEMLSTLNDIITRHAPRHRRVAASEEWLVALCHNDLSPDNVIRDVSGRLWLLDWERAGLAPVAFDVARMCIEGDGSPAEALHLLAALDRGRATLTPPRQLALGLAFCIERARVMRNGRIRTAVVLGGRTESEAVAAYNLRLARAQSLIAGIAPLM